MTRRPAPKGWCPSSLRPMESGDGYIVRIKPAFGRVTRAQLEKIAHLADQFGNGIIELTNRANLQLRGVSMVDHPALIDALVLAGLVDMRIPLTFSLDDCALIARIIRAEVSAVWQAGT